MLLLRILNHLLQLGNLTVILRVEKWFCVLVEIGIIHGPVILAQRFHQLDT